MHNINKDLTPPSTSEPQRRPEVEDSRVGIRSLESNEKRDSMAQHTRAGAVQKFEPIPRRKKKNNYIPKARYSDRDPARHRLLPDILYGGRMLRRYVFF